MAKIANNSASQKSSGEIVDSRKIGTLQVDEKSAKCVLWLAQTSGRLLRQRGRRGAADSLLFARRRQPWQRVAAAAGGRVGADCLPSPGEEGATPRLHEDAESDGIRQFLTPLAILSLLHGLTCPPILTQEV